ncbi:serine/threonine-protein kinase [Paenibacillus sediminis]|uniref:non-specific serine/threonine protein kinase n=1 Tax=Paenibacillus sediminis TaxID=664909 RepID=A0ABS4H0L6_9BACL|nr:serine/threonine-protein kinase [Paenibacillus sediminis]
MKNPSKLAQGMLLGDRYRITKQIGTGGMSHVFAAEDMKLPGKVWAVKESVSTPDLYHRVQDEAQMLITLKHSKLPQIIDFFPPDEDGYTYLVMDFIEGVTLTQYLQNFRDKGSVQLIVHFIDQICEVLQYLHTHEPPIVFRDLKPSNVMITPSEEIRLIDFGIARNYKQEQHEDTVKLGTLGFAAPEQYGGSQSDPRSDLYGLGAMMLFIATEGTYTEWVNGTDRFIRKDWPSYLLPVIRKLLEYDPDDRYQSALEVRSALQDPNQVAAKHRRIVPAGTQVVAVIGVTHGVGTTHTAVAIAHFLSRQYSKVAIAELGGKSQAFYRIQQIVEDAGDFRLISRQFEIDDIHYWRQVGAGDILSLLGGEYSFIVLDLGAYEDNELFEEFLRSNIPIVVGSGAEWRQQDMILFSKALSTHSQHKWNYCMPLAPSKAVQRLKKELSNQRVYGLPLHLDPFDQDDAMDEALGEIFKGYLPSSVKRRRFWFSAK